MMKSDTPPFIISRLLNAPREVVWQAWTDMKLFAQWFGPKESVTQVHVYDLRPGGILHSNVASPQFGEMWAKFVYREVVKPSRLVWEHSFSDQYGNITHHPANSFWPLRLLTSVTLEEEGDKTKLTLSWVPFEATEMERKAFVDSLPGMKKGWEGTFGQLETFLRAAKQA